jgi:hypothetical protein
MWFEGGGNGNNNAIKHGFYSSKFTRAERKRLEQELQGEIIMKKNTSGLLSVDTLILWAKRKWAMTGISWPFVLYAWLSAVLKAFIVPAKSSMINRLLSTKFGMNLN